MYSNCCTKCGSTDLFTKKSGNNTGLYCTDCGSWIKWLGKNELAAFNNSTKQSKSDKATKYVVSGQGFLISLAEDFQKFLEQAGEKYGVDEQFIQELIKQMI